MSATHHRELFTVKAALDYLKAHGVDIHPATLYRWIKSGEIDYIRATTKSRNIKIERSTLDMLLIPR